MPDWTTISGSLRIESTTADTANSRGTAVTSGASNVKGSYVELIASTSFPADSIFLNLVGSAQGTFLIDIAVGSASSEQVIIENLFYTAAKAPGDSAIVEFPVTVPEGSRLSARCQKTSITGDCYITCKLLGNSFLPSSGLSRVTTYGAATADSGGVAIDPGATANTKGIWTQIVASTTNNIRYLIVAIGNSGGNFALSTGTWLMDIAVGAASSEQIIMENIQLSSHLAMDRILPDYLKLPANIPAGTRISARLQSTITDATDRLVDIVLYGVD